MLVDIRRCLCFRLEGLALQRLWAYGMGGVSSCRSDGTPSVARHGSQVVHIKPPCPAMAQRCFGANVEGSRVWGLGFLWRYSQTCCYPKPETLKPHKTQCRYSEIVLGPANVAVLRSHNEELQSCEALVSRPRPSRARFLKILVAWSLKGGGVITFKAQA